MLFFKIFLSGFLLILIGGFAYLAMVDIPVHQQEVVQTLPASHFQK